MPASDKDLQPRLRLKTGNIIALGPGKIQLLQEIQQQRSISAAARAMKMSYRRAWLLVDTMNTCFRDPLVLTATGGSKGGGAELSSTGHRVLELYARYMRTIRECDELAELSALLTPVESPPQ